MQSPPQGIVLNTRSQPSSLGPLRGGPLRGGPLRGAVLARSYSYRSKKSKLLVYRDVQRKRIVMFMKYQRKSVTIPLYRLTKSIVLIPYLFTSTSITLPTTLPMYHHIAYHTHSLMVYLPWSTPITLLTWFPICLI